MTLSPPPGTPAAKIRPGRHWYVTGSLITAVLILLGMAVGLSRLSAAVDAVDTGQRFGGGDTVTLRLTPGGTEEIWLKDDEFGPRGTHECGITGPGGPVLRDPSIDMFVTWDEAWHPLYAIEVSQAGDYKVTCSPPGASPESAQYAFGNAGGFAGFLGGVVWAVALSALGVGVGAAVILVTAVRRRSHRRRLIAERGYLGGGHSAPPGQGPGVRPGVESAGRL
jgi:hypothetical protein